LKIRSSAAVSATLFAALVSSAHAVDVVFDYSYDSVGFFTADKRAVLDQVAQVFSLNLTDTLTAIVSSGSNRYDAELYNPQDPFGSTVRINDFSVAADELRVFVGSQAFASAQTLGVGGPGFASISGSAGFVNSAFSRGQAGALLGEPTDFASWGGTITFGRTVNWYVDTDVRTLESFTGLFDFYTVAMHEMAHVLGFGTADSWFTDVSGTHAYTGEQTVALNGGVAVALQGSDAHFASSVNGLADGVSQQTLLAPSINPGRRKYMTDLDWAALDDIGWEVASLQATVPVPEPRTWAMMLGGIMLIGAAARRRA
jgi:hypothetical protein